MSYFEKNLEALRRWMPRSAERVADAAIPVEFAERAGTDRTVTFAAEEEGRVRWLGGTSMPQSSAAPLVKGFDTGATNGVNGLGLSIGTGFEWKAFAEKLGPAQAVFVYEPDTGLARMALTICDLVDLLACGKIVLAVGTVDEASGELAAFLESHPGYEPPSVMHPLGTLIGERRNQLLTAGEQIARRAMTQRQGQVAALLGQWRDEEMSDAVIAFTRHSRYAGERVLEEHIHAGKIAEVALDRHDSASVALRLKMLTERKPRRIVSDFFRAQLGCVPRSVAVETWIPPLIGAGFWETLPAANLLGPWDRIVVHAEAHRTVLEEKGFGRELIDFRKLQLAGKRAPGGRVGGRVALIGDLPVLDAPRMGITLPTHQAIFRAAVEILREEYLSAHFATGADVLRRALERAGVASEDAGLREGMLKLIRNVLLPNVPLVTLAEQLQRQEIPLKLIGDWPGFIAAESTVFGAFGDAERWDGAGGMGGVAVLVHLSPWGVVSPLEGEAIGAGVAIAAPQHASDGMAGSLATLLTPDVEYARFPRQQFLPMLRQLLKDGPRREQLAAAAAKKLSPTG